MPPSLKRTRVRRVHPSRDTEGGKGDTEGVGGWGGGEGGPLEKEGGPRASNLLLLLYYSRA